MDGTNRHERARGTPPRATDTRLKLDATGGRQLQWHVGRPASMSWPTQSATTSTTGRHCSSRWWPSSTPQRSARPSTTRPHDPGHGLGSRSPNTRRGTPRQQQRPRRSEPRATTRPVGNKTQKPGAREPFLRRRRRQDREPLGPPVARPQGMDVTRRPLDDRDLAAQATETATLQNTCLCSSSHPQPRHSASSGQRTAVKLRPHQQTSRVQVATSEGVVFTTAER
jgi:hypothetical protein